MKRLIFSLSMLIAVGLSSAQSEKKVSLAPGKDTTSVNRQLQKESDLKTMDAVKTQGHEKPMAKPKNASKSKDTTKVKKRAQRKLP